MRRTGSAVRCNRWPLLLVALATSAYADVEFYQSVDRSEVGTEDVFRLTLVVSGAPDNAQVKFPTSQDFEILSRSQSTQASLQFGGGGSRIQRLQKYVITMRANRPGNLTIPPAMLITSNKTYKTEAVQMIVKRGRTDARAQNTQPQSPFGNFPGFPGMPDPFGEGDEGDAPSDIDIPRSDSDLFLRASVDQQDIFVGQQTTLSVYIYSRVDLSSVDQVTMPKLDGFWSEDVESPSQLAGEQKILNGVPYRAYLLKRRALFPVKAGQLTVDAAEADITTGFLFAGHRVHRKSNTLTLKVKPLPPNAPPGMSNANVGEWRLYTEMTQQQTELGQPITVRVVLDGRGNLKNIALPPLTGPAALRIYDPTTTDKSSTSQGRMGGRRLQEYLVMAQQTGTFTLPGLSLPYFNPESSKYEVSHTEPLTLTVLPGAGGQRSMPGAPQASGENAAKNILSAGGLRRLRDHADFKARGEPIWRRGFFFPMVLAPVGLWLGLALVGLVRARLSHEDESSRLSKQAREARRRLAGAERIKAVGKAADFYAEVEKALLQFLEAKLGVAVSGLRREALAEKLASAGVSVDDQKRILTVFEHCDLGRYAPGAAGPESRDRVLSLAVAAMEAWDQA
ncbi:MAG: BatD family protein [Myxococcaceae bacterium]